VTGVRRQLEERFSATIARELSVAGTRRPPDGWPTLALPPALRETMVGAASLDGGDGLEALSTWYCDTMPARLVGQLFRDGPPGQELLWRSLDRARMPRLAGALEGLFSSLRAVGLAPERLLGAGSPEALCTARPTPAALYAGTLFGTGLPLLGAYPGDLALLAGDGRAPETVIDHRLAGNLVHELCHGRSREVEGPVPWLLIEAAALHLGSIARRQHVFPDEPGEAVPGVALFVLVGEALARRVGRRALWSILDGNSPRSALGERIGAVLEVSGWQDWRRRRAPPFVHDALDALDVVKLIDATRGASPLAAAIDRALEEDPLAVARELPDLVAAAGEIGWHALPWWSEPPDDRDAGMVEGAVRALFQINVLSPNFQTHPTEAPGARIALDVAECVLSRQTIAGGLVGEPPRWLFPPSLARLLSARGARRVTIEGATRARIPEITAALHDLLAGSRSLDGEITISLERRAPKATDRDVFSTVASESGGFFRDAARVAAHDLALFAALDVPRDFDAIVAKIGVDRRRVAALVGVLLLDGDLRIEGDRIALGRSVPCPARAEGLWGQIAALFRAKRSIDPEGEGDARRRFHRHLVDAGAAAARATALRFAPFLDGGLLVDAGGGAGGYTAAFLDAAPSARAILIDREPVIALAREELARFGERVQFLAADLLTVEESAISGARMVLLANVLHLHGPEASAGMVARLAGFLDENGRLLIKDLPADSPAGALFSLNMALFTGEGLVHPAAHLEEWLRAAGLVDPGSAVLPDAIVLWARRASGLRRDAPF
jgi:hypothetical protein